MKPVSGEANGDQAAHRHADRGERIQGRGKRWLLLRRWKMVRGSKRSELQALFAANRRLFKAHVLREQLDRLWTYKTRTGVSNFLNGWIDALRWQRFPDMDRCIHFGEDPKKLDDRLARDFGQATNRARALIPAPRPYWSVSRFRMGLLIGVTSPSHTAARITDPSSSTQPR